MRHGSLVPRSGSRSGRAKERCQYYKVSRRRAQIRLDLKRPYSCQAANTTRKRIVIVPSSRGWVAGRAYRAPLEATHRFLAIVRNVSAILRAFHQFVAPIIFRKRDVHLFSVALGTVFVPRHNLCRLAHTSVVVFEGSRNWVSATKWRGDWAIKLFKRPSSLDSGKKEMV